MQAPFIMIKNRGTPSNPPEWTTHTYTGNGTSQTIPHGFNTDNQSLSRILGIEITKEEIIDMLKEYYPERLI